MNDSRVPARPTNQFFKEGLKTGDFGVGPSRHFATLQHFGRFRSESGHEPVGKINCMRAQAIGAGAGGQPGNQMAAGRTCNAGRDAAPLDL